MLTKKRTTNPENNGRCFRTGRLERRTNVMHGQYADPVLFENVPSLYKVQPRSGERNALMATPLQVVDLNLNSRGSQSRDDAVNIGQ